MNETKMQTWAATNRGRLYLAVVQGAILGIAVISIVAEVLSR